MKRKILILLTLSFSSVTQGTVISLISENYDVSASYYSNNWGGGGEPDNYSDSMSGNTPLTIEYFANDLGSVMSSVSPFRVEAFFYDGFYEDVSGTAFASASWVFEPLVNELIFQFDYYNMLEYDDAWAWLMDQNTGVYIVGSFYPFSPRNVIVDKTHSYLFMMEADVSGYNVSGHVVLDASIIPEPTTLVLLALGGLMLRKRGK